EARHCRLPRLDVCGRAGRLGFVLGDRELHAPLLTRGVADRRTDQSEEMALDPVAREGVRDGEHELVVAQLDPLDVVEPRAVRGLVEGASEPTRNLAPQAFSSQLD